MTTRDASCVLAVALAALAAAPALAQQGAWQWQVQAVTRVPDDASEDITDLGTRLVVDAGPGLELGASCGLSHTFWLDLTVSASAHSLGTADGFYDGLDLGRVWLPVAELRLEYRPALLGRWHPRLGAGVGFGVPVGFDLGDEGEAVGLVDVDFEGEVGLAVSAGVLYDLGESWFLRLDLSRLDLATDATLSTVGDDRFDVVRLTLDPWTVGLGVGGRF